MNYDCLINIPVLKKIVAFSTAIRQGRPYSRATTDPWDNKPPNSVTKPPKRGNIGVQAVSVNFVIKISPF